MADIAAAISATEQELRDCIRLHLREAHGEQWFASSGLSEGRRGKAEARRDEERRRRDSAATSNELIDFTDLEDLSTIVRRHWDPTLKPIFNDLARFQVWMEALMEARVAVMHSRILHEHEEHLILGATGYLRNLITLSRTTRDPNDQYFARIERVIDSLGNIATTDTAAMHDGVLHPGDVITFECLGWDPEGTEMVWYYCTGFGAIQLEHRIDGSRLTWTVTDRDIAAEATPLYILLAAQRPYHRHGWHDGMVTFKYRVLPRR